MRWYPCMKTCPCLLILLAWLIPSSFNSAASGIGTQNNTIQCIGKEREALLLFKQETEVGDCGLLASWDDQEDNHSDCCKWPGIGCDKHTGHVISVHLGCGNYYCYLHGKISPWLLGLKNLKHLDLSCNGFHGEIPHQLGNLSSLTSLDLSKNPGLYSKSLGWLSHLTLLTDINLSLVNLSQSTEWLQIINGLPFLRSLHLDYCSLSPTIPPTLSYKNSSTNLRVLSIVFNTLNDSPILEWLSNLTRVSTDVEYLDLQSNGIAGPIPNDFGRNMHSLSFLELSGNELRGPIPSAFGNMYSLSYLELSLNKLQGTPPSALGNLHLLSHLSLSFNALDGLVPGSIFELKLLEYLDLSHNNFQGIQFSNSPGSLCSLQTLDLSNNNMINDLSSIIQSFSGCTNNSLVVLDVHNNSFWGSIPNTIGTFSSLERLELNSNQLNGTISPSLGQLSMLEDLDLSSNSFKVTLSNHHFSNLSRLTALTLSNNPELVVSISDDWVPPFQLQEMILSSCNLGPKFPKWLLNQTKFSYLDISYNGIFETIPTSLWNISESQKLLNLSHNEIFGVLPNLPMNTFADEILDLSFNHIEGAIPSFLGYTQYLFLNDNRFSGSVAFMCPENETTLSVIDISNNFLSGELPDCWNNFVELNYVRLDNNNFTGNIPRSLCGSNRELQLLSMRNNSLSGELHLLFENCSSLNILDLGYNSFTGYIPESIGNTLRNIKVLNLRRNHLFGGLPSSLCNQTSLSILDLSFNHISGTVPECICNLQGMTDSADNISPVVLYGMNDFTYRYYVITEMIMWKKKEQIFSSNLGLMKYMAISDNQLQGEIPSRISCLRGLTSLDLGRNNLTGFIPRDIGELTSLEFLDLSSNHLSGQIPSSLANLNFLGILNVSCNNLSGRIPTGTQLQRLDPIAYMGNPGLCGPPLAECTGDPTSNNMPKGDKIPQEDNDSNDRFRGLYISVVLGFIVGFWGVCGTLVIKRSWRHTYFRFLEDMYDKFHVMVAVTIARVRRRP